MHGNVSDARGSRPWSLDPRRSLAAGALWLIVALAVAFSTAAGLWVGQIARDNVVEQHVRRLDLETNQLSTDLGQAIGSRIAAVHEATFLPQDGAASVSERLRTVFEELESAAPTLDWMAIADSGGTIIDAREAFRPGDSVIGTSWFKTALTRPWLGLIDPPGTPPAASARTVEAMGEVALPVRDRTGEFLGVVAAHLRWTSARSSGLRLTDESGPPGPAQAYVVDRGGVVLIGSGSSRGQSWQGLAGGGPAAAGRSMDRPPHFERLAGGVEVLVAQAPIETGDGAEPDWRVLVSEPRERVFRRANAVAWSILEVSLCLGAAACLLGAIGALHLTRRLKRLTESVATAGRDEHARIEVPAGQDEVARLASAFDRVHTDLQRERHDLRELSSELERRVAVRTREVERLAGESRYAAMVRERLKIARDLHDTLAHSMMAMLSEIRFLRKLQARDPAALSRELAHAEEVAREGLKEARSAITQMRASTVRESGLGPALSSMFEHFIDRTGLTGEFQADGEAARFGDERAETLMQMALEGLRNIERHARATRADMALRVVDGHRLELSIEDNGAGFDPAAVSAEHYGLVGLREQADVIGAELSILSSPGAGTRLTVTVSLSPIAFAGYSASSSSSTRR